MKIKSLAVGLLFSAAIVHAEEWKKIPTQGTPPAGGDTALVFAMPNKGAKGQIGFFGGFVEAPDYTGITQPASNDFFNSIHIYDIDTKTWSELDPSLPPTERGFVCGAYHENTDALYIFGGSTYTNTFSEFNFSGDTWKFDFLSETWTEILTAEAPADRAAAGCALIGDSLFLFGGNRFDFFVPNDLWEFDIHNEEWSELYGGDMDPANPAAGPAGRIQPNMAAIPGEDKFILLGGENFPDGFPGTPAVLDDVWVYDVSEASWSKLKTKEKPEIPHEFQGFAVISDKYFLTQNGDAQGETTGEDTCPWIPAPAPGFPGGCFTPATPTRDTLFYKINAEMWEEVVGLADDLPSTKRSGMVLVDDNMYLFGGYDWQSDDTDPAGFGKRPNMDVFKLELSSKYL